MRRVLLGLALCAAAHVASAGERPPDLLERIGFDQRLGTQVPTDAPFRDEQNRPVRLRDYLGARPVVLVLGYYRCRNLCTAVREGVLAALERTHLAAGRDYTVVAVSIDPADTPAFARAARDDLALRQPAEVGRGWHLLSGPQSSIAPLARAVGFRYFYDAQAQQFAHAAGLVVLTPHGVVSRYLYGVAFEPTDLRLALVESSQGRVGSPIDRLLLLCCRYDPATGRYGWLIWNLLRLGGGATVLVLVGVIGLMLRRERAGRLRGGRW